MTIDLKVYFVYVGRGRYYTVLVNLIVLFFTYIQGVSKRQGILLERIKISRLLNKRMSLSFFEIAQGVQDNFSVIFLKHDLF